MAELYLHSPIQHRDNFTCTSEVSTEMMIGFWAVTLCSLVGVYERFGGYPDDRGSMIRWNISIHLPDFTA
jgi:hypothetical protein